jgi:hypothetical protein
LSHHQAELYIFQPLISILNILKIKNKKLSWVNFGSFTLYAKFALLINKSKRQTLVKIQHRIARPNEKNEKKIAQDQKFIKPTKNFLGQYKKIRVLGY